MIRTANTLQRLERILVMVPWLLDRPGVSLDEVAERFATTPREIARDLDVLGYCGLPGYGGGDLIEASVVGDRVSVRMADFFSRPLRLSVGEAVALLLAARALAAIEGLPESRALARAAGKLAGALGGDTDADAGEVRFAIDLRAPGDEHLPALRQAVEQHRVVQLVYRSASKAQTTERDVEPWALVASGGAWYLQGYCRSARGRRDFRLDRVQSLEVTGETADPREADLRPPSYEPHPDDLTVVLDLEPDAWWSLEQAALEHVEDVDGRRRVTLRTQELEWLARLVLRLGPRITVIDPPSLVGRVRELAAETLARYEEPTSS